MAMTLNTKPEDFLLPEKDKKQPDAFQNATQPDPVAATRRNLTESGVDTALALKALGQGRRGDFDSPEANVLQGARLNERLQRRATVMAAQDERQKVADKLFEGKKSSDGTLPIGVKDIGRNASSIDREKYIKAMSGPTPSETRNGSNPTSKTDFNNQTAAEIARNRQNAGLQTQEGISTSNISARDAMISNNRKRLQELTAERMSNPNRLAVGRVVKAETTDGVTLWDKANRQDADMTVQDRVSAVTERLDRANQGDANMHSVRRSVGPDGQIRTTTEARPTITTNKDGGKTVSGIYGTVTTSKKTPENKATDAFAGKANIATTPTNLSLESPFKMTMENTVKTDPFTQSTGTTPTPTPTPTPVTSTPSVPTVKAPTTQPNISLHDKDAFKNAITQKTGKIPVPKPGQPVDTTNANLTQVKGYNPDLPAEHLNNISALQNEAERQRANEYENSPEGKAERARLQKIQDDMLFYPRKAWELSGQVGQSVVDAAGTVGSKAADAFAIAKDFITSPKKQKELAAKLGVKTQ